MKSMITNLKWIKMQISKFFVPVIFIVIGGIASAFVGIYRSLIMKGLIDAATTAQLSLLYWSLLLLTCSILIDVTLSSIVSSIRGRCSIGISNRIQKKLYERLMKISWIELEKYHSGDILTRMTSDVDAVTSLIVNVIPSMFSFSIQLLGAFIVLLFLAPHLALIIILVSPVTMIFAHLFSRKLKCIYIKFQNTESKYRSLISESVQNMIIVKSFCCELFNVNKIEEIQKERQRLAIQRNNMSIISGAMLQTGSWIGFIMVFIIGSFGLSKGTFTFGTITALLNLVGNIQGPFAALSSLLPQVASAMGSIERLIEIENLEFDSYKDPLRSIKSAGILYKDVDFSYKKDLPILRNISVSFNPGETVALIGSSGEGKTTFIYLLLSLLKPTKGHLYIKDALNKVEVSASTRKFISYVPQGNTLFSGTVGENLRLGNLNATDEELNNAAKAACAYDFIMNLPEGFNTVLSEKGVGLSEGQAQRIAIARALLHKTPILLLDEATSALDAETETKVLKSIQNLNPALICIIITHRTAALNICHRIFKIEDNHLVEQDSRLSLKSKAI
ncbi:ABC transporter ATP-binding protein [Clostridiaceae bacterium UIB06]|uniref:ABC transporter ATP-binding protein n=1 Tax=Clostridium thailandense TaxID=2794346 RepID=A0A949X4B9_9CLOT|nr:ABC transporter ATP-binding protein [Clostridium thailandense]MBV7276199.1 ABC transporter ATP-binding protein [Clostridium thailandense]MCH5138224.1 ABC transporter ATP-binding protein [Clostridiaceae bacterium UIB06]